MKLGVVTPWFGRDLKGGAEQQAWQIAMRLARRGHSVEILTTCCRSHQDDWATNHFPPGRVLEPEGFAVHRFPVEPRDRPAFDRVCAAILNLPRTDLKTGVSPVAEKDAEVFAHELIKSTALLAFLREHRTAYEWVLFLPYLYGPVLDGVQIVGERAVLQPCLHDEAYAYLPQVVAAFYEAKQLFFNSEGEQELAFRLYGPGIIRKSTIVGEGVEIANTASTPPPQHNGATRGPNDRFVLYLGRKDPGKNVPLLLRAFERFRAVRPNSTLKLVLAGAGTLEMPDLPGASDAGLVSNEGKEQLLRECVAVVQPSENESFSRVMMEAWLHGKPIGVHARCGATALPVAHTEGGWIADSEDDWTRLFVELDRTNEREFKVRGEKGRRYASFAADWDAVIDRYEDALANDATNEPPTVFATPQSLSLNQFLPNLTYGDAISNEAIWIRDQIRRVGFRSEIFVQYIDPRVAGQCQVFSAEAVHGSDAVIYHHSIGTEITPHVIKYEGPKYLIYHNITPGEFFEKYRPAFAQILYKGREDLARLAQHFEHSVGDSAFNAAELAHCGFSDSGILPLAIEPAKWSFPPDAGILEQMQDGRTNILFVGRFAPNKKQDDLIRVFSHYLEFDPDARLILAGKPEHQDPYVEYLDALIAELGLKDCVLLPGSVHEAQLAAYYRTADLFWSMSEHEGFCVPLIEAMWFDIPILAFKSSAVPETLGDAALLFTDKDDFRSLAAFGHLVVRDVTLRAELIRAQRRRRNVFLPRNVLPELLKIIGTLVGRTPAPAARVPGARIRKNGQNVPAT